MPPRTIISKAKTEFERPKLGLMNDDTTFKKITDQEFDSPIFKRSTQHVIGAKHNGATTEDVRLKYILYFLYFTLCALMS